MPHPNMEGSSVISKIGRQQSTQANSSGIACSPGEQLGGTIARKHPIKGHSVDRSDGLPQGALVSIGVIAKSSLRQTGTTGRPGCQ